MGGTKKHLHRYARNKKHLDGIARNKNTLQTLREQKTSFPEKEAPREQNTPKWEQETLYPGQRTLLGAPGRTTRSNGRYYELLALLFVWIQL